MRVANISSDRIVFHHDNDVHELPYGELEKSVSSFLYDVIVPSNDREIVVINGPGSFTNLRIVTLALNTMNMLNDFTWTFYSLSKLDWYDQLFRGSVAGVKRFVVMYIGQRKNIWLVDLEKLRCSCGDWQGAVEKVSLDNLVQRLEKKKGNWCLDSMYAEWLTAVREQLDVEIMYVYKPEHLEHIALPEAAKLLEPHYMIDANVN